MPDIQTSKESNLRDVPTRKQKSYQTQDLGICLQPALRSKSHQNIMTLSYVALDTRCCVS